MNIFLINKQIKPQADKNSEDFGKNKILGFIAEFMPNY